MLVTKTNEFNGFAALHLLGTAFALARYEA